MTSATSTPNHLAEENRRLRARLKSVIQERQTLEGMVGLNVGLDSLVHREMASTIATVECLRTLVQTELNSVTQRLQLLDEAVKSKCAPPITPVKTKTTHPQPHSPKSNAAFTFMEKEFSSRPSLLEVLLQRREFQSIYYALLSVLFVSTIAILVQEYFFTRQGSGIAHSSELLSSFNNGALVLTFWLAMFAVSLLFPFIFQLYHTGRISRTLYTCIYKFTITVYFTFVPYAVQKRGLPVCSCIIVLVEQM